MRSPPTNRRRFRRLGSRRLLRAGVVTVEFAICAPIVFFFFLSMIEVSRFHVLRHSLDQAVYLGARVGIVPGATAAEVDQAVRDRLALAGVIDPTVTITPSVLNSATTTVTVRVEAPYEENSWTLPKLFSDIDVIAEMTLDHENVAFN
ncbi:TadE-like protein [Botrimarina colliarenosi]|uniref:TadE-like protein n=1 Tax=Botrimarina colliarenosi TaxID=2528001 RepID=A0A5C6A991_9BACT|nr:TadE family protein [Botrimarina colliarenosi]TWT95868.1 TadE-like protein [Botrimarina colliarenosi]